MRIHKLLAIGLLTLTSLASHAQDFEGSIYFTKSNMVDVTQYAYHVKGNMVRIDEITEDSDKLEATLLVNLESGDMVALSHQRNLYMDRPQKSTELKAPKGAEVIKGQLKRSIHGMNCSQIRVRNKEANTEVMYWVTDEDNFAFFPKLLETLKRKDNFSTYYLAISDVGNRLPLMAQENTLLREKKGYLQVDKIERKKLENAFFEVPEGFAKVER